MQTKTTSAACNTINKSINILNQKLSLLKTQYILLRSEAAYNIKTCFREFFFFSQFCN